MASGEAPAHPWLDPLWQAAEANWADPAIHQAILAQCDSPDRLAEVARRYRRVIADPERAPVARQQLDQVTGLAFAQLTPRSPPPDRRRTWLPVWLFLLLLGAVALARRL
jgi:hypothetical protein